MSNAHQPLHQNQLQVIDNSLYIVRAVDAIQRWTDEINIFLLLEVSVLNGTETANVLEIHYVQ